MKKVISENQIQIIDQENAIASLQFETKENQYFVTHTYVNPMYRGRKLASQLMEMMMELGKQNQKEIIPICSYAKEWLEKNKVKEE